ncbi:MAG: S58 family peptidase [Gemmatimonadetes bacterium]|nr:S58 family peptidase [Gemmatimonadota bacterium]
MVTRRPDPRLLAAVLFLFAVASASAQAPSAPAARPRARDLGVPFDGTPGPLNAITDVAGIEVGYTTLIQGEGRLVVGQGPVRTGVTAILPRGRDSFDPVMAGFYAQNGNGEMTGTVWIEEAGELQGPVMITNTHSVGVVRDAVIEWQARKGRQFSWLLPVVAETYDGGLNDINGFHVKKEHVFAALDSARGGKVQEGNVGGGTGMGCNGWKGGSGTSSRRLSAQQGGFTVGVFLQCNAGGRASARIAGVPISEITEPVSCVTQRLDPPPAGGGPPLCGERVNRNEPAPEPEEMGSIIVVVATDAPLMPHQLKRIARRVSLGLGRDGMTAGNGSGDIFVAFSTGNPGAAAASGGVATVQMVTNARISALFEATVQASEEAVVNAMIGAETMTGANYRRSYAIPHDAVRALLRKYGRLRAP